MKEIRIKKDNLIAGVHKISLLRHLSAEAIDRLISEARMVECDEGERIITEHAIETTFYVILEGACKVVVAGDGGDSYIATVGPGQVVGEAALFSNFPRTASVDATTTVRLMEIEREPFLVLLRDEPTAGLRMLFTMVHALLAKLREVNLELAFERRDASEQTEVDRLIESLLPADEDE